MEILLLGHMGRDDALADRLTHHRLHVVGEWRNPGLVKKAEDTGGTHRLIDTIKNTKRIANIVESLQPDMFLTNFDDALAAGVVNAVRCRAVEKGFKEPLMPLPDRLAARPEWDKFYCRDLVEEVNPDYNPLNFMTETVEAAEQAIDEFASQGKEMALKPRNLTGGKGVWVQGKHFNTAEEAKAYARKIFADPTQSGLEVQEKLEGHEFTLQIFTDGKTIIKPPVTYDYPYREDGDSGPGTGGMGSFSMAPGEHLPFLTDDDYQEVITFSERMLALFREINLDFKGVFYPTFFKTADGLKMVEINTRGGDPELINMLDLIEDDVDLAEVLQNIATGTLSESDIRYKNLASTMVYLVAPEYGYDRQGGPHNFGLRVYNAKLLGCDVQFAAAEANQPYQDTYSTVGNSRTVGLSATGKTPWEARHKIQEAIDYSFEHCPLPLDYRQEIGQEEYIRNLVS